MRQRFELVTRDAPGLLARVEAVARRQRTPVRSLVFEGDRQGDDARLHLVVEADEERSRHLERLLLRLEDVLWITRRHEAFASEGFPRAAETA